MVRSNRAHERGPRRAQVACAEVFAPLYDECGVYAFSCYGQHHAVVLYGDLSAGTPVLLTPRRLAVAMQTPTKKTKIVDALSLGTRDPDRKADLREWANNYIQAFGSGA